MIQRNGSSAGSKIRLTIGAVCFPTGFHPGKFSASTPNSKTGRPTTWPLRYTMISWSASLKGLTPGKYVLRARAVDLNGFAQPEPRSNQKTGMNTVELREFEVV